MLQHSFLRFPRGWPAVGLLLLRLAVGATECIQASSNLIGLDNRTLATWIIDLVVLMTGVSLLIGFLTSAASVVLALINVCSLVSLLPAPNPSLIDAKSATAYLIVMAAAIALLGPGAFSVDARMFGPREITIPGSPWPK
jgi:uncharacterized membrane protein YphA (DoxX/SURF4 family)